MNDLLINRAALSNRRLRQTKIVRGLVGEVSVHPSKLIQPLFGVQGLKIKEKILGLTGVHRETNDSLLKQIEQDLEAGVNSFLYFGVPSVKTENLFNYDFTTKQISEIKKRFGSDLFLSVDVCLCSYTSHGHCGVLNLERDHIINDQTVTALAQAALCYAEAGADCIAPSDMMDHRIRAIREILDESHFHQTLIMSYSAKFHSSFYGPFRLAADSAPKGMMKLNDRATYQIDPKNASDAYRSSLRDLEEGADIIMVKPGLPYLDIIKTLADQIPAPLAVYEVSGEYAAIEIMSEQGLINKKRAHLEAWTAFFRAGAEMVITYGAREATAWIKEID
jgi:porphobilinogen synthase